MVKGIRRADPASERRYAKSREYLRELCDRLQVAARRTGTCELAATGDGSSPIGRRSAIDRIAP